MLIKNIGQLVTPKGKGPIEGRDMADLTILDNSYIKTEEGEITDVGMNSESTDKLFAKFSFKVKP